MLMFKEPDSPLLHPRPSNLAVIPCKSRLACLLERTTTGRAAGHTGKINYTDEVTTKGLDKQGREGDTLRYGHSHGIFTSIKCKPIFRRIK